MAARGAVAKEIVTNKILEMFVGSFKYDKEIRIPIQENGETIQLKVALTAAKTNVGVGEDEAVPAATVATATPEGQGSREMTEPTEDEKERLAKLIASVF